MSNDDRSTLLDIMEQCRVRRYSGAVNVKCEHNALMIWFVRGNLTHAETRDGLSGWKALEALNVEPRLAPQEMPDELPPQRTIRVETSRLIRAMKLSQRARAIPAMSVPVPFHARLQLKFQELKHRITGLQSYEAIGVAAQSDSSSSGGPASTSDSKERTIVEKDPRGSRWVHQDQNRKLILKADDSISTAEIMWAGAELWKELDRLNRNITNHER